ncbi:MAG: ComEA family DNA-binding protein [Gordonia sp. (in: high G+C Gram-positive bacteria)]|uniref:helix-hairpin-helix domain-containing protein n=1 Tax=Gordonia sp. (in: high G+C Gram-positive bacteria) TaxID=84139 RepID=UPI0039E4097A
MTRIDPTTSRRGLDRLTPATDDPDEWGSSEMPDWLATGTGRTAWAQRRDVSAWSEVLEDDGDEGREDEDREDDDEWARPPRRRLAMIPPAAVGLVGVGVIAAIIAGYSLLKGGEPVTPVVSFPSSAGPTSAQADGGGGPASSSGAYSSAVPSSTVTEIVVSVAGLVHRPGLVHLPPDARVADALDRAGGGREGADLLSLNLAQPLRDGDQVLVGTRGAGSVRSAVVGAGGVGDAGGGAGGRSGASGSSGAKVDLNTATAEQLDALPGVGPVTAQAIIGWREQHGGFSSADQLAEVDGIGPARLAKLRDLVTAG